MENILYQIPEHLRPSKTGTDRLFSNRLMEKLTRTHISIPVTTHLIIVAGVSYYALQMHSVLVFSLLFAAGTLAWTFAEYWVHRYVYHVETKNPLWVKIQDMGHSIHHRFPNDPTRLAMPPVPALILASVFFGLFWLIMQQYSFAFFPGFFFGYVLYISIHYAEHRFKAPKFGPLNRLWKNHALHHFKYPETKAFGVSTILWDFVFGTLPPRNKGDGSKD